MAANFLFLIENSQLDHELLFEIMKDFRKGGLNPTNYAEFIALVKSLPPREIITKSDYNIFNHLNLIDISEKDSTIIIGEIFRRSVDKSKKCWHPEAGSSTCKLDKAGRIWVSAAHSIQNNGILSRIASNGHVMTFSRESLGFEGKEIGKKLASIFWGFCNNHDAIFSPIEIQPYSGSSEQHFLYAYRAFVVSAHKKNEASNFIDYGDQYKSDIEENKKIFDKAILSRDYNIIETGVIELPAEYPIAVSSSFYLDFDFNGNPINHSDERMENIYVTVFPDVKRFIVIISYFKEDRHLYGDLVNQIKLRNKLKSDITVLLAAHTENIYFEPEYFSLFIANQAESIEKLFIEAQFDFQPNTLPGEETPAFSLTPNDYLNNQYELNFFGY